MQTRLVKWFGNSQALSKRFLAQPYIAQAPKPASMARNKRGLLIKHMRNTSRFDANLKFIKRCFATWSEPEIEKSALVDEFPGTTTADLLKQIENRFPQNSTLSPSDSAILKRYSDTLNARAENGEEEAKLAILLAANSGEPDENALSEATSWLEVVCAKGENVKAMYYYALYLATGSFEEIAVHTGGTKPDPIYYIDVDNLDQFLGLDRGVAPEGTGETFDFKKWLRTERRKRLVAEKNQSSEAPASSGSCSSKKAANLQKAVELLRVAADKGDIKSLVTLMLLRFDSDSTVYSPEEAQKLLDTVVNMKSGLGMLRAAEILGDVELYEAAAETNYPEALYQWASILFDSNPDELDPKAVEMMYASAKQGYKPAQYWAAQIEETLGKFDSMLQLYRDAASYPDPDQHASFQLGNIYYNGLYNQPVNYPLAFKYWKMGARSGHEDCLVNLASMYYNGIGTKQDFEKAFYCNQNAAVLGSKNAMANLADMYEHGIGVPKSDEQAQYYRNLANDSESDVEGQALLNILQETIAVNEASKASENSSKAL